MRDEFRDHFRDKFWIHVWIWRSCLKLSPNLSSKRNFSDESRHGFRSDPWTFLWIHFQLPSFHKRPIFYWHLIGGACIISWFWHGLVSYMQFFYGQFQSTINHSVRGVVQNIVKKKQKQTKNRKKIYDVEFCTQNWPVLLETQQVQLGQWWSVDWLHWPNYIWF